MSIRCQSPEANRATPPANESGYALITTIWFLLLGTMIVSAVILAAVNRGRQLSTQREEIQRQLAIESVIDSVVADIVFRGPRSSFAVLPSEAQYSIEGVRYNVSLTSEQGKLDVNRADPVWLDRALRGLGVSNQQRTNFLALIAQRRASEQPFQAMAEVEETFWSGQLMPQQGSTIPTFCVTDHFTIASGLSRPSPAFMSPELARALGEPQSQQNGERYQLGYAVNIKVTAAEQLPQRWIVRVLANEQAIYQAVDIYRPRQGCL